MERCIILNGDYTFLNVVDWKRAICLIVKGKVEVLKYSKRVLKNCDGSVVMNLPIVMRLIKLIRTIYRSRVPFSKKNVFIRDNKTCVYCGTKSTRLTIDHVLPASKGGKTDFDNCVAACKPCNNKKGRRTPREAKMFLIRQPFTPTISEFLRLKMKQLKLDEFLKELGVY